MRNPTKERDEFQKFMLSLFERVQMRTNGAESDDVADAVLKCWGIEGFGS